MNFKGNFLLWCVLLLTKQCVLTKEGECVQRRLGACKVLHLNAYGEKLYIKDFHSPQPESFALRTSIEINLFENKHSFENNLPVERKRPIGYNLNNAAVVAIDILLNDSSSIGITLGQKYYRLAELQYYNHSSHHLERKYSSYTPILPIFPYNLNLEMTTNGTFSVYADANTEPFLLYQLDKRPIVERIAIFTRPDQTDLIAFVDCSEKHKPNCGSHRVDKLYGCREWMVEKQGYGSLIDFEGFQKTYKSGVLFDEFVVVDIAEYSSRIMFEFSDSDSDLKIGFTDNSIEAILFNVPKSVRTTEWPEIPGKPYAVHVLLTIGTDNNRLTISNVRGEEILTLNLCGVRGSLEKIHFFGPKFYFDCLHPDKRFTMMSERPRKTIEHDDSGYLTYHENGYDFSKTFLDTRQYVTEPLVIYEYTFGNSTEDWCEGELRPELFSTSEANDDPLQSIIKSSNNALLSELEKISNVTADIKKAITNTNEALLSELQQFSDQNNATADTNKALLSELEKITAQINATADTNKAIANTNRALLSELQSVKASIDSLATHFYQNTTSVN